MLKLNRACLLWTVGVLSSLPLSAHATVDAVARWKIYDSGSNPDSCSGVHDIQNSYNGVPQNSCNAAVNFSADNPRSSNNGTSYNVNSSNFILGGMSGMLPVNDTSLGYDAYTGSRTITAWINVGTTPGDDKAIVYLGRDSGGGANCTGTADADCSGFHLVLMHTGEIGYGTAQGGVITTDLSSCGLNVTDDAWHFVVGVYSADKNDDGGIDDTFIYVDNVLCGSANMATVPFTYVGSSAKFAIGSTINNAGTSDTSSIHRFHGMVDDVRVFDRYMGQAERTALWNSANNGGAD